MLATLGYEVEVHTDAEAALRAFREDPDAFDLVITDLTMPGMTGGALAAAILELRPDVPVLLCSGFAARPEIRQAMDLGIRTFVQKPVVIEELARAVRNALEPG